MRFIANIFIMATAVKYNLLTVCILLHNKYLKKRFCTIFETFLHYIHTLYI